MAHDDDLPIDEGMADFTAEVRITAHLLWEQAGRPSGKKDEFWYKALDQHIRSRANAEKLNKNPPSHLDQNEQPRSVPREFD